MRNNIIYGYLANLPVAPMFLHSLSISGLEDNEKRQLARAAAVCNVRGKTPNAFQRPLIEPRQVF